MSNHDERLMDLELQVTGQEGRVFRVFQNLFEAWRSPTWPKRRRLAAVGALVRFFLGRPLVVVSLSLAGILALQANLLLAEQNEKIALQNHLSVVSAAITESQRNSALVDAVLPGLLATLTAWSHRDPRLELEYAYGQVAFLTRSLRPYPVVETYDLVVPQTPVALEFLRRLAPAIFGGTPMAGVTSADGVPVLSAQQLSPERARILAELVASEVNVAALARRRPATPVPYDMGYPDGVLALGADFSHADFRGHVWPEANFGSLDLSNASFNRARLDGSNLNKADLTGADFTMAMLHFTGFKEAELSGASFASSVAISAGFNEANLTNADLSGANFTTARFDHATLTGASFAGATLHDASLDGADLQNADFSRAVLVDVELADAKNLPTANFELALVTDKLAQGPLKESADHLCVVGSPHAAPGCCEVHLDYFARDKAGSCAAKELHGS